MAIAKCAEGVSHAPVFDLVMCSGFDDGPYIGFEIPDECWPEGGYDGEGYFIVNLMEILEEAIVNVIKHDYGDGASEISSILREYADKMDAEVERFRGGQLSHCG